MERKIEKKREKENGIDYVSIEDQFFGVKTTTVYVLPSKVTPRCCCCCGGVTTVMKHSNPVE